ncbi:MAG: RHS repeat-associated core domain-containing protein, partial [Verrucomicrobiota bacterium]
DFTPYTLIGPVHAVTNTYEATRNALVNKANTLNSDASNVSAVGYNVNSLGQRVRAVRAGASASITDWFYDDRGQVIKVDDKATLEDDNLSAADRFYQYDYIGNRIKSSVGVALPGSPNYTTNSRNQYSAAPNPPDSPVYEYDDDGNATAFPLTPDGTTTAQNAALVWDAENRLISSTPSVGSATTYLYDALGRRIAKKHGTDAQRIYLYDGWNCLAEYESASGSVTLKVSNFWGLDFSGSLQGAGGVGGLLAVRFSDRDYYPLYDGNGNITEYLDSTGAVAAHYEYDPFGRITSTMSSVADVFTYRFSTKPFDAETGLYYYGYRYYEPITGRWLSRDPIGESGGFNLYGMVENNPLNRLDSFGLSVMLLMDGSYIAKDGDGYDSYRSDLGVAIRLLDRITAERKLLNSYYETGVMCEGEYYRLTQLGRLDWEVKLFIDYEKYRSEAERCGRQNPEKAAVLKMGWGAYFFAGVDNTIAKMRSIGLRIGAIPQEEKTFGDHFYAYTQSPLAYTNAVKLGFEIGLMLPFGEAGLLAKADAAEGTTTLWRSVSAAELRDVGANGLRQSAGSMGNKWFAESAADAAAWGKKFYAFDKEPVFTLRVEVPDSVANQMLRMDRLDGIGP